MVLRSAAWASLVIESASSNIISLYGGPFVPFETAIWAKFLTFVLMISIPRSSEAFNSKTRALNRSRLDNESISLNIKKEYPYISLAKAKIVEVFPVPGGP